MDTRGVGFSHATGRASPAYVIVTAHWYELVKEDWMKLESLKDLYIAELQDIYDAEEQITKALPKMARNASTPQPRTTISPGSG